MRLIAISTILISLTSTLAYAGAKCGNGVRGPRCGNGGGFTFADGGFTSGGFSSGNNFVSFGSGTPVGSVVQLGVTNPNGEPSGQIRIVRDEFGRNVFQALDVFGNVIAQTLSFIQGTNQPFFDENTGLSRDGRQRLFAGASNAPSVSTVSTTGTTGSTATAAEIQPAKLVEIQGIYSTHLRGEKIDIGALEAQLGRPLANESKGYQIISPGADGLYGTGGLFNPDSTGSLSAADRDRSMLTTCAWFMVRTRTWVPTSS